MANKVFLKTTKSEGKAKLYTQIKRNGLRFIVCTGIQVTIEDWNKSQKSQSAQIKYAATPEGERVNGEIVKVTQAIDSLFTNGLINTKEDKHLIEEAISDIVNVDYLSAKAQARAEQEKQKHRIIYYYEQFFKGISEGTIRTGRQGKTQGRKFSKTSVNNWGDFGNILREFCDEDTTFEEVNQGFADRFTCFIESRGYMETTLNVWIGFFVQLCRMSAADGVNNNVASLSVWKRRNAKPEEKKAAIYLTDEELEAMYKMELTGNREWVRDLFILGCLTCQRWSDYTTISRRNITQTENGTPVVKLVQKKTGTTVEVPIFDKRVIEICEKYDYKFPSMSNGAFNENLQKICHELSKSVPSLAEKYSTQISIHWKIKEQTFINLTERIKENGWKSLKKDDKVVYNQLKKYAKEHNGQPLFERDEDGNIIKQKWELVTSHTARRSGITNLYREGVLTSRDIMTLSGHKSEIVFNNYVKATTSERADDVFAKLRAARA